MGAAYSCVCLVCSHEFSACEGGGIAFALVRCQECGNTANLNRLKMAERYRAWQDIDDCDEAHQVLLQSIESFIGRCECGGRFDPWAPVRCPQCGSTSLEKTFVNKYD